VGEEPKVEKHYAYLGIEQPISREHAAEVLGISVRSLDRLVAAKKITHEQIGRRVILRAAYLREFIHLKKITARGGAASTLHQPERNDP